MLAWLMVETVICGLAWCRLVVAVYGNMSGDLLNMHKTWCVARPALW